MNWGRSIRVGITILGAFAVYGLLLATFERTVEAQAGGAAGQAPRFEVDRLWPKPLPNLWILGSVNGVAVDAQDHIWLVQGGNSTLAANEKGPANNPPTSTCCAAAPFVLEFDITGNLLGRWGGPGQGYQWPVMPAGIAVDPKSGSVVIGGLQAGRIEGRPDPPQPAGRGGGAPPALPPTDAMALKFSRTGQFQLQIGKAAQVEGSNGQATLNRPVAFAFDNAANELYIADGLGNRRVLVVDANTGAYKRHWGAYGEKPDDAPLPAFDPAAPPARQFRGVTCVELSRDGMVYVCDRQNNRIQVFQKDGKFLREAIIAKTTLGDGAVWDLAFSPDPKQQFVYVADGHNKKVRVLRRDNLAEVSSFGQGGRLPGTFYAVGSVAVDSRGNVYTGETSEGKRIQKWVYRGMGPAGGR